MCLNSATGNACKLIGKILQQVIPLWTNLVLQVTRESKPVDTPVQIINLLYSELSAGVFDSLDYVLVGTPGQIEIFTWSASGTIITEVFASTFPTVIAYVVDIPRSSTPVTFMSNMLYACSILYKTILLLVLAFNKTDVAQHEFAFEVFQA
ncbi:hypothetical protein MKX01_039461 [Papaver californicum]|nr:hypothetical protein MKX01_039461 [Papaver californicum]